MATWPPNFYLKQGVECLELAFQDNSCRLARVCPPSLQVDEKQCCVRLGTLSLGHGLFMLQLAFLKARRIMALLPLSALRGDMVQCTQESETKPGSRLVFELPPCQLREESCFLKKGEGTPDTFLGVSLPVSIN